MTIDTPHPPVALRDAASDVWLAGVFMALAAACGAALARLPGTVAPIALAPATAIAFMATADPRRWPAQLALFAALAAVAGWWVDPRPLEFLPSVAGSTLAVLLASVWLARSGDLHLLASDGGALMRMQVRGALLPAVAAQVIAAGLALALGGAPTWPSLAHGFIGAALGAASLLPLALMLRTQPADAGRRVIRPSWPAAATSLAVVVITSLAVHAFPYPFVVISVVLLASAFLLPRVSTFANAALFVLTLGLALALHWDGPRANDTLLGHAQVYLAALLVVVPAQAVAVVVARRRALAEVLAAVGSRDQDLVVFADLQGRWRWVGQSFERYFGTNAAATLGLTWRDNLPADLMSRLAPALDTATRGEVRREQMDLRFPAGGPRSMDVHAQPALDEEGRRLGTLLCFADITEAELARRELERTAAALRASNERLDQFVHIASHDLREPLNAVSGFCALIAVSSDAEREAAVKRYLPLISGGADRLRVLLDDMLSFVRLDGVPTDPIDELSLDELVGEVLLNLRASVERRDARVDVEPLGKVPGHRSLLVLLLQNLISNAVKFVPADRRPRVLVSAMADGADLKLTVSDNGIGILPMRIAELGTPFRRLHARRDFDGTGLGLAICRRIVEQHGGRLAIDSVPGEGSRFHVWLPLGR